MKTHVTFLDAGNQFGSGRLALGQLDLGDLNDPFGATIIVGIDGTAEASLMQAGGHDTMDLIYNSYLVNSSVIKFVIADDTQRKTTYASSNHITATTAGTTTTGVLDAFYFVCIVSADTEEPVTNWHRIMNHPMAFKSNLITPETHRQDTGRLTLELPDHMWLQETFYQFTGADMAQLGHFNPMAGGTQTGSSPVIHMYLCAIDGSTDSAVDVVISIELWQNVTFSKRGVDDSATAIIVAGDHVPTVTG